MRALAFDNPYLDEFRRSSAVGGFDLTFDRMPLVYKYAWAVPNDGAVSAIADVVRSNGLRGVVEIGAGGGYWAWCLSQIGVDVVAVDSGEWIKRQTAQWFRVRPGGPPEAAKHPDRALFLCWPPLTTHKPKAIARMKAVKDYRRRFEVADAVARATNMAGSAVRKFTGDWVIYVGEGESGCTGDDSMWDVFRDGFDVVSEHGLPNFYGIHDSMTVYRRRV